MRCEMPEISVLMSVYNGEEYIRPAIDSILNQTILDYEFIIVNDGSVDRTREIIESYSDSRIKLFHLSENRGVGGALNFGLTQATGKYIAKADADDINHPTRLQKQKEYLDLHTEVALVKTLITYFPHNQITSESSRYKNYKNFRENFKNAIVSIEDLAEKLYWTCCIPHTTVMMRREDIINIGYDPTLRIGEDYKLFYEMNKLGLKMGTVNEHLVDVRVSDHSTTVQLDTIFWNVIFNIKEKEIRQLFNSGSRVYLWGAGLKGESLIHHVLPKECTIAGFIDSDPKKQNQIIAGYQVYAPDILVKGDKVLITSQPGLYAIGDQLKKQGFVPNDDFIGFY